MVSEEFDSIFIHVPKCAGTSINAFLKSNGFTMKSLHQEKDGSSDNETGRYKIGAARRLKRAYSEREWSGYFKFAFVRNPWDRMVSCWRNRGKKYSELKDFVFAYPFEDNARDTVWHSMPQCVHVCDDDGEPIIDHIARFEHLQEDLEAICDIIGIEPKELPHRNRTERKPYQEYYDQETIDRVAEIYKKDIEMFNYNY